jgi:hypothetical protein
VTAHAVLTPFYRRVNTGISFNRRPRHSKAAVLTLRWNPAQRPTGRPRPIAQFEDPEKAEITQQARAAYGHFFQRPRNGSEKSLVCAILDVYPGNHQTMNLPAGAQEPAIPLWAHDFAGVNPAKALSCTARHGDAHSRTKSDRLNRDQEIAAFPGSKLDLRAAQRQIL